MSETPEKNLQIPHLAAHLIGFALALACALWAGTRFTETGSNIVYGALTGLSFGAMFAFGQRIKQHLFPTPESTRWKGAGAPSAASLRPAQRAAARTRPVTVEFDEDSIRTLRGGAEHETIAWQDIDRIVITIGDKMLPMPYWMLTTARGGIRIANDTPGLEALMEQFKTRLPDYDSDHTYQAIINAMGALEGSFDIWHKRTSPAQIV